MAGFMGKYHFVPLFQLISCFFNNLTYFLMLGSIVDIPSSLSPLSCVYSRLSSDELEAKLCSAAPLPCPVFIPVDQSIGT